MQNGTDAGSLRTKLTVVHVVRGIRCDVLCTIYYHTRRGV